MNEDVQFCCTTLGQGAYSWEHAILASLDSQRRLQTGLSHTRRAITTSTLGRAIETLQIVARPSQPRGKRICVGYTGLYYKSIARSLSLPNRLFSYLKR